MTNCIVASFKERLLCFVAPMRLYPVIHFPDLRQSRVETHDTNTQRLVELEGHSLLQLHVDSEDRVVVVLQMLVHF